MRENRTYGSEGGETGQPVFPTPICAAKSGRIDADHLPKNNLELKTNHEKREHDRARRSVRSMRVFGRIRPWPKKNLRKKLQKKAVD